MRWILFILFGVNLTVNAQSIVDYGAEQLMNSFSSKSNGIWMQYFKGTNVKNEKIIFTLATDKKEYKGILQNINQKIKFLVEGDYLTNSLKLITLDTTGQRNGSVEGYIKDSIVYLQYFSNDFKSGDVFNLIKLNTMDYTDEKLSTNSNILIYINYTQNVFDKQIFIQKNGNRLNGKYLDNVNKNFHQLSSNVDNDSITMVKCTSLLDTNKIKLYVQFYPNQTLGVNTRHNQNSNTEELFNLQKNISGKIRTVEQNDCPFIIEYFAPVEKYFDNWLNDQIQILINQIASPIHVHKNNKTNFIRINVEWINNDWISGYFKVEDGNETQTYIKSFNYDLKNHEEIRLEDLFLKNIIIDTLLKTKFDSITKIMYPQNTTKFNAWFMSQNTMANWVIVPKGILILSEISPIYGIVRNLLPFDLFVDQLRKNNLTKRVIK